MQVIICTDGHSKLRFIGKLFRRFTCLFDFLFNSFQYCIMSSSVYTHIIWKAKIDQSFILILFFIIFSIFLNRVFKVIF